MKKLLKFLKLWPLSYALPLLGIAWFLSPYILRWLDPTAATFDPGVLQIYLLAAMGVILFVDLAFLGLKLNFFGLYDTYLDFENLLKALTPWQKVKVVLAVFFGFLYAFVFALHQL